MHTVFNAALPTTAWSLPLHRRVAVALFEVSDWQPWLTEAWRLLDPTEAARVQRHRIAAGRETLALAYALHRLLLGAILDRDPRAVPLYRDRRGCPRLTRSIAHTSLSHADGLIALAVATAGPVGVDIESTARAAGLPEIAERVCHPSEAVQFTGCTEAARDVALLKLWVRKEAVLKAAGVGLSVEMDTFSAALDGPILLPPPLSDAIHVRMLDAGAGCVAALAGLPDLAIDCHWLRPERGAQAAGRSNAGA